MIPNSYLSYYPTCKIFKLKNDGKTYECAQGCNIGAIQIWLISQ